MYYNYWNLHKPPFDNVPDPAMYVDCHASLENAIAETLFAIEEGNDCLAVIVGDVGLGKTLSIRMVMDSLSQDKYKIALITNPGISFIQLLREIIGQLTGTVCGEKKKTDLFEQFNKILFETADEGKKVLIFIDEANAISPANLESLRLLTNMQDDCNNLFTIILAGQIELARRLEHPKRANLFQRIGTFSRIDKIGSSDLVKTYIETRLKLAGGMAPIFTDEAIELIWEYSEQGIPRLINKIAKLCLKAGETNGFDEIDAEIVQQIGDRFRNLTGQVVQKRKPRKRLEDEFAGEEGCVEPFMLPVQSAPVVAERLALTETEAPTSEAQVFTLCADTSEEHFSEFADDDHEALLLQDLDVCSSAVAEETAECAEESSVEALIMPVEPEPFVAAEAAVIDEVEIPVSEAQVFTLCADTSEEHFSEFADDDHEALSLQNLDVCSSAVAEEAAECAEESSVEPLIMPVESEPFVAAEAAVIDEVEPPVSEAQVFTLCSDSSEEALCGSADNNQKSALRQEWYVCSSELNEELTEGPKEENCADDSCVEPLMISVQPEPLVSRALAAVETETTATIFTLCSHHTEESPCDSVDDDQEAALPQALEFSSPAENDDRAACPSESFEIQGIEVVIDIPREMIRDSIYMKEEQLLKSAGVLAAQVLKEHRELTSNPGADPFLLWDDIRKILAERLQREGRSAGDAARLAVL